MDILMQNNRLPMLDGDFQLVDRINETKQHIVVSLKTMYSDWLLNYLKGIDLARDLRDLTFLDHDIKKQISGVEGVTAIKNYNRTFDRTTMTIRITAVVQTIYGDIAIEEVINNAN